MRGDNVLQILSWLLDNSLDFVIQVLRRKSHTIRSKEVLKYSKVVILCFMVFIELCQEGLSRFCPFVDSWKRPLTRQERRVFKKRALEEQGTRKVEWKSILGTVHLSPEGVEIYEMALRYLSALGPPTIALDALTQFCFLEGRLAGENRCEKLLRHCLIVFSSSPFWIVRRAFAMPFVSKNRGCSLVKTPLDSRREWWWCWWLCRCK